MLSANSSAATTASSSVPSSFAKLFQQAEEMRVKLLALPPKKREKERVNLTKLIISFKQLLGKTQQEILLITSMRLGKLPQSQSRF